MFIFTGAVFRIPWVSGVWVSVGNFRSQVVEGFLELYIMFFLFTLEYEKRTNTLHAVILNYVQYINKNFPLTVFYSLQTVDELHTNAFFL